MALMLILFKNAVVMVNSIDAKFPIKDRLMSVQHMLKIAPDRSLGV
jgi:hypothetical protein